MRSVWPARTTPDHAARAATTSSTSGRRRSSSRCPARQLVGVLVRPLPLGARRPLRVVAARCRRPPRRARARSSRCTSGRSSSGWGTLASITTTSISARSSTVRAGQRGAVERASEPSSPTTADLNRLMPVGRSRRLEVVLGARRRSAARGPSGVRAVDAAGAVARRVRPAALVAPHSASWRRARVGDDRHQRPAHVRQQHGAAARGTPATAPSRCRRR